MTQEARVRPGGRIVHTRTAYNNDSDVTVLTVGANKIVDLISLDAQLSTTATVGNRFLALIVTDGAGNAYVNCTAAIAATQYGRASFYQYGLFSTTVRRRLDSVANNVNVDSIQPIPRPLILQEGWTIRVYDVGAIDPAADDLIIVVQYIEYDI